MPRKNLTPAPIPKDDHAMLDTPQAAAYVGLATSTLDSLRSRRSATMPDIPYYRVFGRIRYKKCDLDAWLESCRVAPAPV